MSRGRIMPGHRIVGPPPGKRPSELEDSTVAASTGKDTIVGDYHISEEEVVGIGEGVHSSIPNDDMVEPSGIQIAHAAPPGADEATRTTRLSGVPPPDLDIRNPPTPSGEAEIVAPSGVQIAHAAPSGVDEGIRTTRLSGVPPPDVDIRSPPTPSREAEIVVPSELTDVRASVPGPKPAGETEPVSPGEYRPTFDKRSFEPRAEGVSELTDVRASVPGPKPAVEKRPASPEEYRPTFDKRSMEPRAEGVKTMEPTVSYPSALPSDVEVMVSRVPPADQSRIYQECRKLMGDGKTVDMRNLSTKLKEFLDANYGSNWQVVVIRGSYWSTYSYMPNSAFHFYKDGYSYLLWRPMN